MRWLRDQPVARKLVVVMVLTSSFALILATVGFTANQVRRFRQSTTARVSGLADILGQNSAGALAFGDSAAATRVVESVSSQPFIASACLYLPAGSLLAGFRADSGQPCPVDMPAFSAIDDGFLNQLHEIFYETDQVGFIGLTATREELMADLQGDVVIGAVLMVLALAGAWGLASRLQVLISGPVLHLVSVARTVMQEKNYSIRARPTGKDEFGVLSDTFNQMLNQIQQDVEDRERRETALSDTNRQLREQQGYVKNIIGSMIDMLVVISPDGLIVTVNAAACTLLGYRDDELVGQPVQILFHEYDEPPDTEGARTTRPIPLRMLNALISGGGGQVSAVEAAYVAKDGRRIPVSFSGALMRNWNGEIQGIVCVAQDNTERKRMQFELEQAHKLESVGQLAAGIAHEINTPAQYLGDNTRFLKEAFGDLRVALDGFERLLQAAKAGAVDAQVLAEAETTLQQAEVEYLATEVPKAIDQSLKGIEQVTTIVAAMKQFSHPGDDQKSLVNLQAAIETTITVARNEWKFVAEMVTDFDPDLPDVTCRPGEMNQVFVNLIVNAAQAVGETLDEVGTDRGTIIVGTRRAGEWAEIFVRDTGPGIPDDVRARIFDPFFTTKAVGKGTGQGLAIVRSMVVDKHGGTIDCKTERGQGTTFTVRIPISPKEKPQAAVA